MMPLKFPQRSRAGLYGTFVALLRPRPIRAAVAQSDAHTGKIRILFIFLLQFQSVFVFHTVRMIQTVEII